MNLEEFKTERYNLYFDKLKEYVGEKVVVEFVYTQKEDPLIYKNPAILKEVDPFKKVCTKGIFCPTMYFLGPEYTIVRITTKYGKVLYNNEAILDYLPIKPTLKNLNELSFQVFGIPYTPRKTYKEKN